MKTIELIRQWGNNYAVNALQYGQLENMLSELKRRREWDRMQDAMAETMRKARGDDD